MSNQKLENELISAIIESKTTIKDLLDNGFEIRYLKHNAEIYEWVLTYWQTNNSVPSLELTQTRYPQFVVIELKNPVPEIVDALRKGSEYDRFVSDLSQVGTILQNTNNVQTAKEFLSQKLSQYDSNSEQDVFDLSENDDIDLLYKYFEERKRKFREEGFVGIPSGFGSELDVWLNGGSQAGNLYGMLAPLGVGKTWSMMVFGAEAIRHKKSPFMLMLEGNLEKEGYRALTTVTNISNSGLHTATLENKDVAMAVAQFQKKNRDNNTHYWLALHGNRSLYTPFLLGEKIEKYHPDIVIVDYMHLMGVQTNKWMEDWQINSFISRELKKLAVRYGIAIWAVLQGNRNSNNKEELSADDSSYYGMLRDFDTVLGITRVPDKKHIIRLNGVKGRDAKDNFKGIYRTNWDTGKVEFEGYINDGDVF